MICFTTASYAPAAGPYLRKAPIILEKPDIVYVVENQMASISITLNHVHAVVTWKRSVAVHHMNSPVKADCSREVF